MVCEIYDDGNINNDSDDDDDDDDDDYGDAKLMMRMQITKPSYTGDIDRT